MSAVMHAVRAELDDLGVRRTAARPYTDTG